MRHGRKDQTVCEQLGQKFTLRHEHEDQTQRARPETNAYRKQGFPGSMVVFQRSNGARLGFGDGRSPSNARCRN